MIHTVTYYGFMSHRRQRAFFLLRTAQQMRSASVLREIGRAIVALAGMAAWAGVVFVLGA